MTVIAWDGKTLAADKQLTIGEVKGKITKISRGKGGELLGAAGVSAICVDLVKWYNDGCVARNFPKMYDDQLAYLLVITPWSGIYLYYASEDYVHLSDNDIFAIGSGADYAIGAMRAGADAVRAVEIASEFSTSCGGGVDTLELPPLEEDSKYYELIKKPKKTTKSLKKNYKLA